MTNANLSGIIVTSLTLDETEDQEVMVIRPAVVDGELVEVHEAYDPDNAEQADSLKWHFGSVDNS